MKFYERAAYREDLAVSQAQTLDAGYFRGKKVLVTGAAGLIGSYLVELLLELSAEVYALGRDENKLRERFLGRKLNFIVQDVTSPLELDVELDLIIHAASNANPASYAQDPVGTIDSNVLGLKMLLEYCKNHATQLVYLSSGDVYGQLETAPFTEEMSGYIDSTALRSGYMLSKRLAENLCVAYHHQYGVETKIVRPSHVFGASYTVKDNRVSASFFEEVLAGRDIVLKSAGTQLRSYIYLADVASGILSVATKGKTTEVYNVTNTANQLSLAEFAKKIAAKKGRQVKFELPEPTGQTISSPISLAVLSDEKLRRLGWQPHYDFETALRQMFKILEGKDE